MVACLVSGLISTLALSVLAYAAGRSLRLLHGISSPFFFFWPAHFALPLFYC